MAHRWLILADDLTGAADCAVAFGRQGLSAAVSWGDVDDDASIAAPPVFSYDADSRGMTAQAASQTHYEALGRFLETDRILFKKIDSTLRGQPAAETVATLRYLKEHRGEALGIFVPAFPKVGRTTLHGKIHVSGKPLEELEVWKRDHSYPDSDMVRIMTSVGVKAASVDLGAIRSGIDNLAAVFRDLAATGTSVVVCDAETDDDLLAIAKASLDLESMPFFIGSAGLAHALALIEKQSTAPPPPVSATGLGTLLVVGSLASVSRAGARKLADAGSFSHIPVAPDDLLCEDPAARLQLGRQVTERLAAGENLLIEITMDGEPDMKLGPHLAQGLAEALEQAATSIGAFAATGGETASALLSRFGVNGIDLVDEIEPGISLGLTRGRVSFPVATKAGAFGDENSLCNIASRLNLVKTEGRFS